jgi:hypothetical protein
MAVAVTVVLALAVVVRHWLHSLMMGVHVLSVAVVIALRVGTRLVAHWVEHSWVLNGLIGLLRHIVLLFGAY